MNIKKIIGFFRHDMWHIKRDEVSPLAFFAVGVLKKLYISIEFFTTRRVIDMASALTYSTLLAIVPIFAVVFAIARGFGYNKYIELWFRESLSSQPQAADTIIAFVNSYLVHTKSGVFFGVGLVFMLFTVLMLTANVEKTFNSIWQVKHPRSVYRAVTDYLAMLFLVPIVIVVTSGVSIVVATLAGQANDYIVLGSVMRVTVDVLPYVLMSVVFMGLYAKHQGAVLGCRHTGHPCGHCHAGVAAVLHPCPDLSVVLQRHLRLVCRTSALHALGTDLVDDLSFWRGAVLHQPEHGRVVVHDLHLEDQPSLQTAAQRHPYVAHLSSFC